MNQNLISTYFIEFLSSYNKEKLGFIVSQSNVESYIRTEFAWYLEKKYSSILDIKIFIELSRIDLQIISTTENTWYFIEFGHSVNLHKINVEENFKNKYKSDFSPFVNNKKGNKIFRGYNNFNKTFIHVNMLTEFKRKAENIGEIEEDAATYIKYGNLIKANPFNSAQSISFPFSWKSSNGKFVVEIKTEQIPDNNQVFKLTTEQDSLFL